MRAALDIKKINPGEVLAWFLPAVAFWLALAFELPYSLTQHFHFYHPIVFLGLLLLFYASFRLSGALGVLAGFGLTMLAFALALSFLWTSGYSDNFVIGGVLPYKDAKNYYLGANLIVHGLPIRVAGQALGRPLYPGFLSSLLLLTGQNLQVTLAILVQLAGVGTYLTARQISRGIGALAGALYLTFMFFYFQYYAGYAMSESLGFIGGCFAFALLWRAAQDRSWLDLLLGLGLLLAAVSARAGAFLVFPLLSVWAGWLFRGGKRFSVLTLVLVLVVLAAGYFIMNGVYPRLLGVPEGSSFGNFAYTLYGQVRGGLGWHSAIDELGTRNPSRVYQAAWDVFLADPSGFARGVSKAYADFFLPGEDSVFMFSWDTPGLILWFVTILLLLHGLYMSVLKLRSNTSVLLLAGFVGIFLSIPFLPPVDGGSRFYAATMPFFFAFLALGGARFHPEERPATAKMESFFLRFVSVSLLALTVLLPPVTLRARSLPEFKAPACAAEQRPFVIQIRPGAYIDLVRAEPYACGLAPEICLADFRRHNTEMGMDDFYQELDALATYSPAGIRVIPTLNLLDGYFQYFVTTEAQVLAGSSGQVIAGCASRLQTENQRIFLIESLSIHNQ